MSDAYTIYTDGACAQNPGGRGGWAYVVLKHGREAMRNSGGTDCTTNNRMEMLAAINGLLAVPEGSTVTVISDSQYLVKGANVWSRKWARRGWVSVKNVDLWQLLADVRDARRCSFLWVRGHNGDQWNCECDRLASEASGSAVKHAPKRRRAGTTPIVEDYAI